LRKRSRWWPSVDTPEDAKRAVKDAAGAAVFVSVVTAIFSILAAAHVQFVRQLGIDTWSLVDAVVFAVIAWRIWRQSRIAAWAGLILFSVEKLYMLSNAQEVSPPNLIVAAAIILAFIAGIRGTSALHHFESKSVSDTGEQAI
jgi:hypothetical protein